VGVVVDDVLGELALGQQGVVAADLKLA